MSALNKVKKKGGLSTSEIIFLVVILIIPIAQFLIMYVGVNIKSFALAFQRYESPNFVWAGVENFKNFFENIFTVPFLIRIKNSFFLYAIGLFVSTPIAVMISYAIWRQVWGYKFFQVIFYLPQIISSIVFVIIARNFINRVMPILFHTPSDLVTNIDTGFWTVALYGALMGLGTKIIMYLGAMSNINESVVEYAKLDGMGYFCELWYIVLPQIYGTLSTFIIVGISAFFTDYGALYSFYSVDASMYNEFQTLGYYYFAEVVNLGKETSYPMASAAGLVFSVIAIILTFTVRYLLDRFDPNRD